MARIFDPDKLKFDCEKCDVLCCVAFRLPYDDYQKPAHVPCKHLNATKTLCAIHSALDSRNYRSCTQFDCKGAGVAVSTLFRSMGRTWITDGDPKIAKAEFAVFVHTYYTVLRHLYPDAAFEFDLPDSPPDDLKPFVDAALDYMSIDPPEFIERT
ncbi:MAG: oxetanocin resistance protein [Rhodospirillales bacterium]|jgi:hypothetical protein|nr:oxetanocin resistance protein [Rhodospirillales bacterium]